MDYYEKYIKYKNKYIELRQILYGGIEQNIEQNIDQVITKLENVYKKALEEYKNLPNIMEEEIKMIDKGEIFYKKFKKTNDKINKLITELKKLKEFEEIEYIKHIQEITLILEQYEQYQKQNQSTQSKQSEQYLKKYEQYKKLHNIETKTFAEIKEHTNNRIQELENTENYKKLQLLEKMYVNFRIIMSSDVSNNNKIHLIIKLLDPGYFNYLNETEKKEILTKIFKFIRPDDFSVVRSILGIGNLDDICNISPFELLISNKNKIVLTKFLNDLKSKIPTYKTKITEIINKFNNLRQTRYTL